MNRMIVRLLGGVVVVVSAGVVTDRRHTVDLTTSPPDSLPVTVEHALGTTTVEAEPTRVVTVGVTEQDTVLALGVTPVGVTDWYGDQPYATWPWAQDELGDATPEVLWTSTASTSNASPRSNRT